METLSSIFLSPLIAIELFVEFFLLSLLSYSFVQTWKIIQEYKTNPILDLKLFVEKKSYLLHVLVVIALAVKIVLMPFVKGNLMNL